MMKTCSKCAIEKNFEEFHRDSQKRDGLTPKCKSCFKVYFAKVSSNNEFLVRKRGISKKCQKKRRLKPEIKEKEKQYRNERYKKDEEYRAKMIKRSAAWRTQKRKTDPTLRAIDNARRRLILFFKEVGRTKTKGLGCDRKTFKIHMEALFQPGMTWENHGEWHIDHKYPLSVAFKEGEESFAKACNYLNLQPLWAADNLKKGNKVGN